MADLSSLLAEAEELSSGKAKLQSALKSKHKGLELIFRMSEQDFRLADVGRIPTGELGLDIASGGGWPRGRFIKVAGKFSAGKSKMLAAAVAELTGRLRENVLVIDVEGTWTKSWLLQQGADVTRVWFSVPETAEMALDIAESALESNEYSAIIIDSIAAMSPKDEIEKSHTEWQRGLLSRLVGKFCRKMEGRMNHAFMRGKDVPTIFLANQQRVNINSTYLQYFTPGGTQQDNTASIIVNLSRRENLFIGDGAEEDREYVGWLTQAYFEKNKVAPPLKRTTFGVLNQEFEGHDAYGFYHGSTIMTMGLKVGSIVQNGAWYSVPGLGGKKFQGGANLRQEIITNEELFQHLVGSIKAYVPALNLPFDRPLRPVVNDLRPVLLESA